LLEHFYYGQVVQAGKPTDDMRLLAASPGVNDKIVNYVVERVSIPPLIRSDNGAWALVRGRSKQVPFVLVQAQIGSMGQVIYHYIIAQPDVLKAAGGNLRALKALLLDDLPAFDTPNNKLQLLELTQPEPASIDEQIDDILELMTITRNKMPVIETLLAAIVQGVQLIIQGAPPDLNQRIQFIMGLLALLPPSARFGVTFTTHSLPTSHIDAQIRFYSDDVPPQATTIFNWSTGLVTGEKPQDDYSHFVISQLRLDAELVIQQNTAMASIAGWRLNQGDKLADSLAYASTRLKIDTALQNNQPVSKDEVARILAEDPTLPDDLQIMYAMHLVKFSLAMQDMQHAAPVAVLLRGHDRLEQEVLQHMSSALDEGLAWLIYDTLIKWMDNPLGPQGQQWVNLTHRATLEYLKQMIEDHELDEITTILRELHVVTSAVNIEAIVPQIVKIVLPLAYIDAQIADNLFLLGVKYLAVDPFRQLMNMDKFRSQLNPQIVRAWTYINTGVLYADPAAELVKTARDYGENWEPLILLRFAEIAAFEARMALLQTPMLAVLLDLVLKNPLYASRVRQVVSAIERVNLADLQPPAPRYLLQIRLALGDYEELARQMLRQLGQLYAGDRQMDYLKMIGTVFATTQIPVQDVPRALKGIHDGGVKSVPLIVASISAIQGHVGAMELDGLVDQVAQQIVDERYLIDMIPPEAIISLLDHYTRRKNSAGLVKIANVVPLAAQQHGTNGIRMITDIHKRMDWDARSREVGLQVLRTFVRLQNDPERARKIVGFFGKELGLRIRRPLEVTYLVQRMLGFQSLDEYATQINTAVVFLHTLAEIYGDPKNTPGINELLNGLGAMPGAMTSAEKQRMADNIRFTGRAMIELGKQFRAGSGRDPQSHINGVLRGEVNPISGLDVLLVIGGHLVKGARFQVQVIPSQARYPLEPFTLQQFQNDFAACAFVLRNLMLAFPTNRPPETTAQELIAEIDSLESALETDMQNVMLRNLARDIQYLVDMILMFEKEADAKLFENSGLAKRIDSNKHKPRHVLEFIRFVYGYYV